MWNKIQGNKPPISYSLPNSQLRGALLHNRTSARRQPLSHKRARTSTTARRPCAALSRSGPRVCASILLANAALHEDEGALNARRPSGSCTAAQMRMRLDVLRLSGEPRHCTRTRARSVAARTPVARRCRSVRVLTFSPGRRGAARR